MNGVTSKDADGASATRDLTAGDGTRWEAFAQPAIVAHGRPGAALAFRMVDGEEDDVLLSTITFNSMEAADFALRTMSGKDLLRRLTLARRAAGGV